MFAVNSTDFANYAGAMWTTIIFNARNYYDWVQVHNFTVEVITTSKKGDEDESYPPVQTAVGLRYPTASKGLSEFSQHWFLTGAQKWSKTINVSNYQKAGGYPFRLPLDYLTGAYALAGAPYIMVFGKGPIGEATTTNTLLAKVFVRVEIAYEGRRPA